MKTEDTLFFFHPQLSVIPLRKILFVKSLAITHSTKKRQKVALTQIVFSNDIIATRIKTNTYPVDISVVRNLNIRNPHKPSREVCAPPSFAKPEIKHS